MRPRRNIVNFGDTLYHTMKHLFSLSLLSLFFLNTNAQNTVTWTASYQPINATEGEILIHASILTGWHLYSQKAVDDGPIATTFTFPQQKGFQLLGSTAESEAHEEFDKAFGTKIRSFSGSAEFRQKVKLAGIKKGEVLAFKVEFMTCDDMTCLPPKTVDLSVSIP